MGSNSLFGGKLYPEGWDEIAFRHMFSSERRHLETAIEFPYSIHKMTVFGVITYYETFQRLR